MIFYYSATGNTESLVKKIAEKTSDKMINIEEALKDNLYDYQMADNERLGFAFPIYYGDIPDIFVEFVEKLNVKSADHYYGYIVVTDGGMSESAPDHLVKILLGRGITINGVFGLKTVDTSALYKDQWSKDLWEKLKPEVDLKSAMIAEQIYDRTTGQHAQPSIFPKLSTIMMKPLYALMRKTSAFKVSEKCIHCGLCAKSCPIHAIEMQNDRPVWVKNKCMTCLRCLHHCPAEAIDFGSWTKGKDRYKQPII